MLCCFVFVWFNLLGNHAQSELELVSESSAEELELSEELVAAPLLVAWKPDEVNAGSAEGPAEDEELGV